jgi:hypothetical protein
MSEPVAIATIALEHCDIVLLSDDSDGFGFYVASEHTRAEFVGIVWRISGDGWVDLVDHGDLGVIRSYAPAAFRRDLDSVVCEPLVAVLIRGEAPARWEG